MTRLVIIDDRDAEREMLIKALALGGKSELMRQIAESAGMDVILLELTKALAKPKPPTITIKPEPLVAGDYHRIHLESMKKFYKK